MTDTPLLIIDHNDGTYSLSDHGDRIVIEGVSLEEIVDYLEDRNARLHPEKDAWEEVWDRTHPPPEPPIDLKIDRPTVLGLTINANGRLTVKESETGAVLVANVSLSQVFSTLNQEPPTE